MPAPHADAENRPTPPPPGAGDAETLASTPVAQNADDASLLMHAAAAGDRSAADRLLPLVYEQLRKVAQLHMASERPGQTLSATALVHEAYLRLAGPREVPWAGRAHFYAAAAESMRRILIDRARSRTARDRTHRRWHDARDLADFATSVDPDQVLAFDDALTRLESVDASSAQVVRLRFFAGLSIDQTAAALGLSPRTVDREWAFARAWLHDALRAASTRPQDQ